jgi:bacterioferritin-associated ferredoxin
VCFGVSFAEILELARPKGWTEKDVEQALGCGSACGMCKPYIREALRTGEVSFDKLIPPDS